MSREPIPDTSRSILMFGAVPQPQTSSPAPQSQLVQSKLSPKAEPFVPKKFDYSATDLVIYHGKCPDGTSGAWVLWQLLGKNSSKFYPGKFGETPPNVTDKNVVFVDFTYPADVIKEMLTVAKSIRVLDHHKTALPLTFIMDPKFSFVIDMERSGVQIAWDEVNFDKPRPWFVDAIADRDLWQWKVPNSVETCLAMFSLGYYDSIEKFDAVQYCPKNYLIMVGSILNDKNKAVIDSYVKRAVDCVAQSLTTPDKTWKVRVVECDHTVASDVGNDLVADGLCDFAIMFRYDITKNEWWCSARASTKNDIDLTTILKHFDKNSGGHPKAAGFTLSNGLNLRSILTPAEKRFNKDT